MKQFFYRRVLLWACLALFVLALGTMQIVLSAEGEKKPQLKKFKRAVVIHLEGPISHYQEQFIFRSLSKAHRRFGKGSKPDENLVILQIDSPGGTVDSSKKIAYELLETGWAHTVAYVPKQAISGAAMVSLGCDEIVMHPSSQMGDVGPIVMDEFRMFQHVPEKIVSNLSQVMRVLAERNGHNPALAEAMVNRDLTVYRVENTETKKIGFMTQAEIDSDENPDRWKVLNPVHESRADHFLQVSGSRAVELQLANANVDSYEALLKHYGIDSPPIEYRWGAIDTTVAILNFWLITGLLFTIGLIALYAELSAPGISIGGFISFFCFALFFWSHFLGGTANWLEVVLFITGVVFLLVEIFVIPGFGVAGIAGLLLMLAGVILASQEFVIPSGQVQWQSLLTTLLVILGSGVAVIAGAMTMSRYFGRLPLVGQMALKPPGAYDVAGDEDDKGKTGKRAADDLAERYGVGVGDWGVADSPLRPAGVARFEDNYLDVVADGSFINRGTQVRIVEISGNRIVVRLVEDKPPTSE